jgi:MoaA/NifB/PqqE/SkfB family radical SAM enzyme
MTWQEFQNDLGFAVTILRRRPFQCLLQVTNRCNLRCRFCGFWTHRVPPKEELTLDDFRRLAEELADLGHFLVSLEGGEPLFRSDLVDIVRIFSRRHLTVLYTNGWFVEGSTARELFHAGLTQVGVSIDYPEAARHDSERGLKGTFDRAWRAVDRLRQAAPYGGKQVHVMTVLMRDNRADLERLLSMSAAHGVGHCLTLLAPHGSRRKESAADWPSPPIGPWLWRLWQRYPHLRLFREYLRGVDRFLTRRTILDCRAGIQSFNIDHVGNVSSCIEKIDLVAGNVRRERLAEIYRRLAARNDARGCRDCWTLCRGFNQALGTGGTFLGWIDLIGRMRSR